MDEALTVRLAEIQELMQFVTLRWPDIRSSLGDQLARRCQRCILSDRCTPVREGLCDVCRAAEAAGPPPALQPAARRRLESALGEVLTEHQGRGPGSYDALVLFSGGKDSAFLLHRLRRDYSALRVLAVTIDNGFFSRVALANCRQILEELPGIDHLIFQPQPDLYRKTFRHALTHLNDGGCYTTVDRMDGDLTFDIGRNLAASLNIPLMIAGLSPEQVERILGLRSVQSPPAEERKRRTHSAGFTLDAIYSPEELRRYWWDGTAWATPRVPRVLYPFYAWRYDEDFVRQEVIHLGLIHPGQDNPLATNNDTIPVMLAVDYAVLGYSGFEPEFAQLVRTGRADREFWLSLFQAVEYLSRRGEFMPASLVDTLTRLGLSHRDVGLPEPPPQ